MALIHVLHEAEQRLENLTAREVDAVANSSSVRLLSGAQEKLRRNQEVNQAAILNALHAHVALIDTQGRIVLVNDAWTLFEHRSLGLGARPPVGANYLDCCTTAAGADPASASQVSEGIRSVLSGVSKSFSHEYRCQAADETRWFLMRLSPLSGSPPDTAVIMQMDVTSERMNEENLRTSESRFRQMADSIQEVFFLRDADDGRVLYVSPAYEQIWGRSCESLYRHPRSWTHAIHPDDRASKRRIVRAARLNGLFEAEYRIVRPDHTVRWIQSRGFPVRDGTGSVTRIAGIAIDITERKEALALLDENRRRLALATDSAHIGIWDWEVPSDTMTWDDRMYSLYGIHRERSHSAYATWQTRVHPEDLERAESEIAEALAGTAGFHTEFRVLWPTGEVRYIEAHATVVRDEASRAQRMTGVNWDITPRRLAEVRLRSLNRMYAMLSGINTLVVRVCDCDELFEEACRIGVAEGGFQMALICTRDPDTKLMVPVASAAMSPRILAAVTRSLASPSMGVASLIEQAATRKLALVSNLPDRERTGRATSWHCEEGIRSTAMLPFIVQGEAGGVMVLYSSEKDFFHEEEMNLLRGLASDIALAMDSIEKQRRLDYLAHYDSLTGLANRTLFLERVATNIGSALAAGRQMALCLIDIERFKSINDSLGRLTGDALLCQVGEWLKRSYGDASLLARTGADHFAMLLPQSGDRVDVAREIERKMLAFEEQPFELAQAEFRVSAKVGVALYPDDGGSAEVLFTNAEAALKKAKATGHRFLFYTQRMTDAMEVRLRMENRLRHAIEKNEFVLHYQPKVSVATGEVVGAEALIRWNDPVTGLVQPDGFVRILEESGLIIEVGRWVLRQASDDYLRWCDEGLRAVPIAINVSPLQLRQNTFESVVRDAIARDCRIASGLEIEITENAIMEIDDHIISSLHAIRELGIRVAIDDFGTGFSSLSYLAKLPLDCLKIDRSFVVDMLASGEGLALVQAIIDLAHALRLIVVAEGVESDEQLKILSDLGCDEFQGYLFCRPVGCEIFEGRYLRDGYLGSRPARSNLTDEAPTG